MSKSAKANIARKLAAGSYHPQSFKRESHHEAILINKMTQTSGSVKAARSNMTSLADFFPKN